MPTYCYECEGCETKFEKTYTMNEIERGVKPTCPECRKRKTVFRDYSGEGVHTSDSTPQTVGALADRNSNRMSTEEKIEIRRKQYTGRLPEGGSTYIEDKKGRRIASQDQKKVDPKSGKHKPGKNSN